MAEPVIKVFGRFSDAEQVRNQLLAAGFEKDQIQLTSNDDEAGAVQGNFITGNADSERDNSGAYPAPMAGPDDHVYERDFKEVVQRGNYVLMVAPGDDDQEAQAKDIIEQAPQSGDGERLNGRHH